jgi:hypothetical protein
MQVLWASVTWLQPSIFIFEKQDRPTDKNLLCLDVKEYPVRMFLLSKLLWSKTVTFSSRFALNYT